MSPNLFAHSIHLVAVILWVGGMAFVGMALAPVLRARLDSAQRASLMGEVGKRFMSIGWMCIAALLASGLYLARGYGTVGMIFKIKIALVAFAILLSFLHDFVLGPRLTSCGDGGSREGLRRRVIGLARLQFVVVMLIVVCAVMLRFHP